MKKETPLCSMETIMLGNTQFIICTMIIFQPENVMCVTRDSNDIKLIDFGLAQRLEEGKTVKVLFGTAEFCAPEIINYQPVSFPADMWSLGVVAYVL